MTTTAPPRTTLLHARLAVYGLFLIAGVALGTWTSRIPAIKDGLSLSDGELSIALLGIAGGAIAGMQAVGRLIDRYGSRRVMIPVGLLQGAALALPAFAPNLPALAASMFTFGIVHGVLDVSMNANAVVVERAYAKPIMSSFHAVFSIGGFLGAGTGGLFAHAGASVPVTFGSVAAVTTVVAFLCLRWALPDAYDQSRQPVTAEAAATPGRSLAGWVLFLGVLAFCCLVGEGAAADWSSVYLVEDLHAAEAVGATGYAAFSIMMTAGRLAGDRLTARLGPVLLVRCCGALAGVGLLVTLLIGHQVAGVIGFGLFGAGLSCIIPQVFSAAGHRDPAQSGRALARVASIGYAGLLAGPVLIGAVAELTGKPIALAIPAIMALFVAAAAPALRPARG
ncbi:MFS transporter [Acrocarpospora phusangensis]|uniref:MFS transporter n=1 Tax=Acrocarpospora phusangensis TaxID=1070424 RepID=A0A919QDG9_9ACTN|nr:MFS transporter [Acrocarpospora phusangensis]GIH26708.1 MFS transporter [Acrocarpospora phusangensis]